MSLTVGNWLGGRFADRSTDRTLIVTFVLIAAALSLLAISMSSLTIATAAIVIWGGAAFASTSPLQLRVMTAAVDAPNLASTMNIAAFNVGNALGRGDRQRGDRSRSWPARALPGRCRLRRSWPRHGPDARTARLVRLLEGRMLAQGQFSRFSDAAQSAVDSGPVPELMAAVIRPEGPLAEWSPGRSDAARCRRMKKRRMIPSCASTSELGGQTAWALMKSVLICDAPEETHFLI